MINGAKNQLFHLYPFTDFADDQKGLDRQSVRHYLTIAASNTVGAQHFPLKSAPALARHKRSSAKPRAMELVACKAHAQMAIPSNAAAEKNWARSKQAHEMVLAALRDDKTVSLKGRLSNLLDVCEKYAIPGTAPSKEALAMRAIGTLLREAGASLPSYAAHASLISSMDDSVLHAVWDRTNVPDVGNDAEASARVAVRSAIGVRAEKLEAALTVAKQQGTPAQIETAQQQYTDFKNIFNLR